QIFMIVGVLFILSLIPAILLATRVYMRHRGTRAVTCPETGCPAAVKLDLGHAIQTAAVGENGLRVRACSRWPERRDCGQACLVELETASPECLLRTTLLDWYRGSTCALCGKAVGPVHWVEHQPALLTPGREIVEWKDVAAEDVPHVLATHQRVCWGCHLS